MANRKKGPRKAPEHRRDNVITIRVNDATLRQLEAAGAAAGRSVSQEAQLRVVRTFEQKGLALDVLDNAYGGQFAGVLLSIAKVMESSGPIAAFAATMAPDSQSTWLENPYAYGEAEKGVAQLLLGLRPKGIVKKPTFLPDHLPPHLSELGIGAANGILEAIAGRARSEPLAQWVAPIRPRLGRLADISPTPSHVAVSAGLGPRSKGK